jgi:hypothetical protein
MRSIRVLSLASMLVMSRDSLLTLSLVEPDVAASPGIVLWAPCSPSISDICCLRLGGCWVLGGARQAKSGRVESGLKWDLGGGCGELDGRMGGRLGGTR